MVLDDAGGLGRRDPEVTEFRLEHAKPLGVIGREPVRAVSQQSVLRRLLTNPGDYIWHPEYGAGLPQKIGSVLSVADIKSVVAQQLALEASVAPNPPAQLTVGASPNEPGLVAIGIQYWDAATGVSVSFTITA